MIRKLMRPLAVALFAALTVTAHAEELTAWERFKAYAHHEKEVAVKEGHKLLAATDKKLETMKAQTKQANQQTRAAIQADVDALEAKRKADKEHLDKLQASSAEAWAATREGFSNAYRDLHQAYDKAKVAVTK